MAQPGLAEFSQDPQRYFRYTFLPKVFSTINGKRLLLLFDEYETLGQRVEEKTLEEDVFPFLYSLMVNETKLSFIFAGNYKPSELGEHYLATFGRTLVEEIKVGFLGKTEATQLITEPAAGLMHYDDEAVEAILQLTSGHPFFIQLLCQSLFTQHAQAMESLPAGERIKIMRRDVEAILDKSIVSAENQLQEIWHTYFSPQEQVVLTGISRAIAAAGEQETLVPSVERVGIDNVLNQFRHGLDKAEITDVLETLKKERDTLHRIDSVPSRYSFTIDLLRRWISDSQDLSQLASNLPTRALRTVSPLVIAVPTLVVMLCLIAWFFRAWWFPLFSTAISTTTASPTHSIVLVRTPTPTVLPTATSTPTVMPATFIPSSTPTDTPTATFTPSSTPTDTPTATFTTSPTPTDIPTAAFTSSPTPTFTPTPYPPPELIGAEIIVCNATFEWSWSGNLAEDEWFDVRVGIGEPHSVVWTKEREFTYSLIDGGEYYWQIVICRGRPEDHICTESLAVSERGPFWFGGCAPAATPTKPLPP